jgi:hypothetical protein
MLICKDERPRTTRGAWEAGGAGALHQRRRCDPCLGDTLCCYHPVQGWSGTMRCGMPHGCGSVTSGGIEESGKANDPIRSSSTRDRTPRAKRTHKAEIS